MEALTTRSTELMMEGGAKASSLQLTRVRHKGKHYYEISFTLNARDITKEAQLITTRNDLHRCADLNRAVAFLEKLFPETKEIQLILK